MTLKQLVGDAINLVALQALLLPDLPSQLVSMLVVAV
jgi:hypothetical protein